ncbi:MAG TPA: glucokinase [Candidatus Obscuribacterales bacterium]
MILAGDIGGTKSNLAYFEVRKRRLEPIIEETFPSRAFASLHDLLGKFIFEHRLKLAHACLSIAGPVINQRCQTTNLPWVVDAERLSEELNLPVIWLINDLEANAHGIVELTPADFVVLNEGSAEPEGNQAIISAGTGLGEAGMFWDGTRHMPFACEGGHADFAPTDAVQIDLLRYLMKEHEHVSYELVLSGMGLNNIYRFLRDSGRYEEPAWLASELAESDPAATISRAALEKTSDLCEQALSIFVTIYGAETGNLALKMMALGGIFVGGGIAPKIIEKLKEPFFMKAFAGKGRMRELVESMPVKVITNEKTALLGAARCAMWQIDN